MKSLAIVAAFVLLILGALAFSNQRRKSLTDLIFWWPPGDMRFVPGFVVIMVLILYILSSHFPLARLLSDLVSGWFH